MIQELAELGSRITKRTNIAFTEETYSIVLVINKNGEFVRFLIADGSVETAVITEHDKKKGPIGIIRAKKGHARFLLDKKEEVLGVGEGNGVSKKHDIFMKVLERYKSVQVLRPVFLFYEDKNRKGLAKAVSEFSRLSKVPTGNITFMVDTELLLKNDSVRNEIIDLYEEDKKNLNNGRVCSICGSSDYPVLDEPHGLVSLPKGQTAGSALVSFNESAFESYGLKGNLNSSICRKCARNYIEALRFLLKDGHEVRENDKSHYKYTHRIRISDSTVALFWTREDAENVDPFMISMPDVSWVKKLFESVWNGEEDIGSTVETNMFYSCTISSADARIAVRDWTAISLADYKKNLAEWFNDIEIERNGEAVYSPLSILINATQRDKSINDRQKSDANATARVGSILWNTAIKGRSYKPPLEVLQSVLNRLWKGDSFNDLTPLTVARAAIIKLVINRNANKHMNSKLEKDNTNIAYLCGRLFAVIETMQWKAMGKTNSSIKDRYFAAVATQPAYIFGLLLTKNVPIYQHKIGGYLAKELNEIAGAISAQGQFPQRFSAIEQGEFALGYYFQKTNKINVEKNEDD